MVPNGFMSKGLNPIPVVFVQQIAASYKPDPGEAVAKSKIDDLWYRCALLSIQIGCIPFLCFVCSKEVLNMLY